MSVMHIIDHLIENHPAVQSDLVKDIELIQEFHALHQVRRRYMKNHSLSESDFMVLTAIMERDAKSRQDKKSTFKTADKARKEPEALCVGIRFPTNPKIYYYLSPDKSVTLGDFVMVDSPISGPTKVRVVEILQKGFASGAWKSIMYVIPKELTKIQELSALVNENVRRAETTREKAAFHARMEEALRRTKELFRYMNAYMTRMGNKTTERVVVDGKAADGPLVYRVYSGELKDSFLVVDEEGGFDWNDFRA